MTLQERISDCDALVRTLKKEYPEITGITLKLFDCELDEIEAVGVTKVAYNPHLERAGCLVTCEDITTALWAYTKKCRPVESETPKFEWLTN